MMEPYPRSHSMTDYKRTFTNWTGTDITVDVPSGKAYVKVEFGDQKITLNKEDVCSLRHALGKALRMSFNIYAD